MEKMNEKKWGQDFLERDILDDFDIFIMNGNHKKKVYSLTGIINEFIDYMEYDIIINYPNKKEQIEIKKHIRGICFKNKSFLFDKYGEKKGGV